MYAVAGIVLASLPPQLSSYGLTLMTKILIFSIVAISLDLLVGYAGLPSIGHAMFFGAGAYTVAMLVIHAGVHSFWLLTAAGILAAGLLAILFGILALRATATYFLMLTLALNQVFWAIIWSGRTVTGGDDGLAGIPRIVPELLWSLSYDTYFCYFVLAVLFICLFLLRMIVNSPFGNALVGIRENEFRMVALGYNTWLYKYIAWIVAALFAGLGGTLHVYYYGYIGHADVHWFASGTLLFMVLVGGAGTLWGSVIGAGITALLQSLVSAYTERWAIVLGIVYIFVIVFLRAGIANYLIERTEGIWKS